MGGGGKCADVINLVFLIRCPKSSLPSPPFEYVALCVPVAHSVVSGTDSLGIKQCIGVELQFFI